jgi:ribonuclease-3
LVSATIASATDFDGLLERLGVELPHTGILATALHHRSWCAENPEAESNERLEFLGDAVLGLVVTDYLYETQPLLAEGELAKARAGVVSAVTLAEVARELRLGEALLLGRGEEVSGGREKASILADAMEAVLGAVYLSAGWDVVRELVLRLLASPIAVAAEGPGEEDHKTRLQELAARKAGLVPRYAVRDEGPDHEKSFFATVDIDGLATGHGEGRTKKQAEQAAARDAWNALADTQNGDSDA